MLNLCWWEKCYCYWFKENQVRCAFQKNRKYSFVTKLFTNFSTLGFWLLFQFLSVLKSHSWNEHKKRSIHRQQLVVDSMQCCFHWRFFSFQKRQQPWPSKYTRKLQASDIQYWCQHWTQRLPAEPSLQCWSQSTEEFYREHDERFLQQALRRNTSSAKEPTL